MAEVLNIRPAVADDSNRLAELASQLGYRCSEAEVKNRLDDIRLNPEEEVLVVEFHQKVIGWCSLEITRYFYTAPYAEITGFVIDESYRSMGYGSVLLEEAQNWAANSGFSTLKLRTNIVRKDAHRFYERAGFVIAKQQYTYVKTIFS